jgi:hypothetical protein
MGFKVLKVLVVLLLVPFLLSACATARITQSTRGSYTGPTIHTIALAPGGGALADAIGVELFNDGINVVDPNQTTAILGHVGISQIQIASPESYAALRQAGVDAVLVVKGVMSQDGTPESASVRLTGVSRGQVIAGLTWQNGWGGMRGSMADRTMRKNLADAASEISAALVERIR